MRDEAQTFRTLCEQQQQQWFNLVNKSKGNPDQLWSVFCLESRQKKIHYAQALLLRVEKKDGLQREQSMQIQNQQLTLQIQAHTAQINQLRAALQQQAPAAQSIADVHNQTPPPPYAQ